MFRELCIYWMHPGELPLAGLQDDLRSGIAEARAMDTFLKGIDRLAIAPQIEHSLSRFGRSLGELTKTGPLRPILDALLSSDRLNYEERPKGLIEFHRYGSQVRTAFDEHLVEAGMISTDRSGRCRMHFTVTLQHLALFRRSVDQMGERGLPTEGTDYEIDFTTQDPSTDTMALDQQGALVRDEDGVLVFRPGGHGSLLRNLSDLHADLVLVKNIDNVTVDRFRQPTIVWSKALGGFLLQLQTRIHDLLRRLRDAADRNAPSEAIEFARHQLGISPPREMTRETAIALLDRPIRVCGMVPNEGEPGGGPFWVRGRDGALSQQIVERTHIDSSMPGQVEIFENGTHFNPVFMVLGLRDEMGKAGKKLRVLEWPGLWNGAMARWNTVFVEVPIEVFNPVKTVLDLLREKHQPA
jgi:hypothetical protein